MAARDNVVFSAIVPQNAAAGTVVPLSLLYGVENVRQGYGTPRLKHIRGLFDGIYTTGTGIPIEIKNSNWIDSAGLIAQLVDDDTALNRDSHSFMHGRDMILTPNTSWTINAKIPAAPSSAGTIYVIFEIEYSDVPGYDPEQVKSGAPVMKVCSNTSVTGAANVPITLGSFDNLLQNTTYLLTELGVSVNAAGSSNLNLIVIEGFSNQRGLIRIVPVKNTGLADQIEGTVYLTKQTYSIGLIRNLAVSGAAVSVYMEMIASKNA